MNENQASENERIVKAFQQEFVLGDYYFYYPKNAKAVLSGQSTDLLLGDDFQKKNLPSSIFKIYVITFGIGHPKGQTERYNYEGFSLHTLENQQLKNTGRYGGAPYSFWTLGKYRDYKKGVRKLVRDILKDGLPTAMVND